MPKPLAKLVSLLTPKRRWAQFSLGTMFVGVTVLCVVCAWLAVQMNRANRQRAAVAAIEAMGGNFDYDGARQSEAQVFPRSFLRRWLSRDYFDGVHSVGLRGTAVTDDSLVHVARLLGLQELFLRRTQVTDVGLAYLQGLTRLTTLRLDGAEVTDAGLARLQGLTELEVLSLMKTQVSDAGLSHLQGLRRLKRLWLCDTQVTGAGVARLQHELPNCLIWR